MQQEIIEYRRHSLKGKLLISKKFSKFYLNRFRPITVQEDHDVQRASNMYRSFTLLGAMGLGLLSYRFRKFRVSSKGFEGAERDVNMLGNILNDALSGMCGYIVAHLICCDYIYKHRQYIIERMHLERELGFDRDTFDLAAAAQLERKKLLENVDEKLNLRPADGKENKHLLEYPFAEFVTKSDKNLYFERLRSPEEQEHISIQKENIEDYSNSVARRRLEVEESEAKEQEEALKMAKMQKRLQEIQSEFKEQDKS